MPTRMAIILKNTLARMWRTFLIHHWWERTTVQPLWKTIQCFLKLGIELPYDMAIPCLRRASEELRYLNEYLYMNMVMAA